MDTIDRPDSNVPARYTGDSVRMPVPIATPMRELAVASQASPMQVTPRILIRGLSRHWWRIMLGWLVVSTPLAYAIYALVEPTFEAQSMLRAEPTQANPYNISGGSGGNALGDKPFLETQVRLITTDRVLEAAIAKPGISGLPMIRNSKDPKADLREDMKVEIVGNNTYLIRVSLASRNPVEAAEIVNAVVNSYIEKHNDYHKNANRALKLSLEHELTKLDKKITEADESLQGLVRKGTVNLKDQLAPQTPGKEGDMKDMSSFKSVTEAQYAKVAEDLFNLDMKLLDERSSLEVAREQLGRAQELATAQGNERTQLEDQRREAMIGEAFKKDADARDLMGRIQEAREAEDEAKRRAE